MSDLPESQPEEAPVPEIVPETPATVDSQTIQPSDAISEAARKILLHQFEIMLKYGSKIRSKSQLDDDYNRDAVHDMRVAIRRMRSAIKLLGTYYKKDTALSRHRKTLKALGETLGNVRDLTVFIDSLNAFVKTLPASDPNTIEVDGTVTDKVISDERSQAWRAELDADWQQAEKALEKLLNSGRYASMVEDFQEFLTTTGAGSRNIGESRPVQVRHVLPPLIYTDYTTVRAYETVLDDASLNTLHALRIACKRLRYTLEFFTDVLGSEASQVIEATKAMQDYLGQIQDAQVHRELLEDYAKHAPNRQTLALLVKYLEASEAAKRELRDKVPNAWETFAAEAIRQALAQAIAIL
jgi:CHAD domain-containing protein